MTSQPDFYADKVYEKMLPWRQYTPEEYAAHHWLEWGVFSVTDTFKFQNMALENWLKRLEEILHDSQLIDECRERFLTPDERQAQDIILLEIIEDGM